MSVNNMSVGRDYSIVFYDPNTGETVELGDVQGFRITAAKHDIKSQPYNAPPRFGYINDGYRMTFNIVRVNPDLENFQLAQTRAFNRGEHVKAGLLNETVREAGGGVSRYQYTGFVFWRTDVGDISREKNVTQSAEGLASEKVRIA